VLSAKPTLWDFGAFATKFAGRHLEIGLGHRAGVTDRCRRRDRAGHLALRALPFKEGQGRRKIIWPQGADKARATAIIESIFMARDLITTPSSDMGPAELAETAQALGKAHKAKVQVIVGDDLLKQKLSHGACRRPRQQPRAAADRPDMGRGERSQGHPGRQGRSASIPALDLKPAPAC